MAPHQRPISSSPTYPRRLRRAPCPCPDRHLHRRHSSGRPRLEPSFDYGRVDASWVYTGPTYDRVASTQLTLASSHRLGIESRSAKARHRLSQGESSSVVLSWADRPPPADAVEARTALEQTHRF